MSELVLITGGAGFIGSHLCDALLARGYRVRVLDNLSPQVHGPNARRPKTLPSEVELVIGDVRSKDTVLRCLDGADSVFHLAATVGVGQSMYEIDRYTSVNNFGTAVLLQALIEKPVHKLIVASSMSVYGEGLCLGRDGLPQAPPARSVQQLKAHDWELRDERGAVLMPVPTPESKPTSLASVYALSKYDQELMCLLVGRTYGIASAALRFFNVYGPRQALSNPYTGVLAIFAARLLNGNAPLVYEDGEQRRDFVSVYDVARACVLALEALNLEGAVLNIGSGRSYSVHEVATRIAHAVGKPRIAPEITGSYRVGDIRHCFADITSARERLGFVPAVDFEGGLSELASWLEHESAVDRVTEARAELTARGLTL